MPGFTAEASAYGTRAHYQSTTMQNYSGGYGVIPQATPRQRAECYRCLYVHIVHERWNIWESLLLCNSIGLCL
jgi:hypothetical protein